MTLQIKDYILSVAKDDLGNYNYILLEQDTHKLVYEGFDLVECINKTKGL